MSELPSFLFAVWFHWEAVMGGAVSLIIGIYEKLHNRTIRSGLLLFIGVMCLLNAFFMTWLDEHKAKYAAMAEISQLTHGLTGEFLGVLIFKEDEGTDVYTLASITNMGRPSILRRWNMSIPGLNISALRPTRIPDGTTIRQGQQIITLTKDIMLNEKETIPIIEGGEMRGWLRFRIDGISHDTILNHIATMKVNFSDVRDIQYSVSFDPSRMSRAGNRYFSHSGSN
jgi:hypothetical protein